ncbi:MAG: hypothetical protein J2P19_07415 [Pseudonocardia sp.]|nr:hypothetical protein [Pseudonocardia sp.]
MTELIDRPNTITTSEAATGPIKNRDRAFTGALCPEDAARPDRRNPVLTKEERPRKRPPGE